MKEEMALTRGQRKRLKKKEKFISHKIIEGRNIETKSMLKSKMDKLKPQKTLEK